MMLRWRAFWFEAQQRLIIWPFWVSWLLALALVLLVASVYWGASVAFGWQETTGTVAEVAQTRRQISAREAEFTVLQSRMDNPEQRALEAQLAALQQDIQRLNADIQGITSGLVLPEDMGRLLRGLLARQSEVNMVSLTTLPVENIGTTEVAALYRHGMEVELQGTFNGLAAYVRAIEGLPQKVIIGTLDFTIEQYPNGRATLRLYTLSDREDWLNV